VFVDAVCWWKAETMLGMLFAFFGSSLPFAILLAYTAYESIDLHMTVLSKNNSLDSSAGRAPEKALHFVSSKSRVGPVLDGPFFSTLLAHHRYQTSEDPEYTNTNPFPIRGPHATLRQVPSKLHDNCLRLGTTPPPQHRDYTPPSLYEKERH